MESEELLIPEERAELLRVARKAIAEKLGGVTWKPDEPLTERLAEVQGAFVTLHLRGMLRGCIGYIMGVKPLYLTIAEMARAAAFTDPRFPPLKEREFGKIDIEITVLSPLKKIYDPDKVVVGTHGLLVKRGPYQGVLLPQVPVEQGWDRETFLDHTCMKAGMRSGCWRDDDTEILVFTGEVFGEGE
ncbi:AmmeMemoRadiSam system protein A [candidate division WOR-3 bacterium]|uniref:AmmeMemoRadiSam system protein A n=1 Tax=candidate division WOR-3 bacterium TaxID=2052148 RepID=A0A9D5K7U9_UNCW3|nr:AmmeMemoRadiSam system protein A [candidate division WOR-3 bacterium]MBD3363948.1 AmmeMemoRadiSam system protein A [candidate division WOR-3 bacterium]